MALPKSNYTQIPNVIFDEWQSKLKPQELSVLMAIARKTLGWQKTKDIISLSQIELATGLCRNTVISSIRKLEKSDLVKKDKHGKGKATKVSFELNISSSDEPIKGDNGSPDEPKDAVISSRDEHTKETEYKENNTASQSSTYNQIKDKLNQFLLKTGLTQKAINDSWKIGKVQKQYKTIIQNIDSEEMADKVFKVILDNQWMRENNYPLGAVLSGWPRIQSEAEKQSAPKKPGMTQEEFWANEPVE